MYKKWLILDIVKVKVKKCDWQIDAGVSLKCATLTCRLF